MPHVESDYYIIYEFSLWQMYLINTFHTKVLGKMKISMTWLSFKRKYSLTHWGQKKMTNICAVTFKCIILEDKLCIFVQFSQSSLLWYASPIHISQFIPAIFCAEHEASLNPNNKSDVKRRNTLGCLDQYTCEVLRLWHTWYLETD